MCRLGPALVVVAAGRIEPVDRIGAANLLANGIRAMGNV
jgi:hypothetical protein